MSSGGGWRGRRILVIARHHLSLRGTKQSRLSFLSSRAQRGNLALHFCHCEGFLSSRAQRGDLALHFCHCEGFFSSRGSLVIASAAWRSRLSTASKQTKERLLRRLATPKGGNDSRTASVALLSSRGFFVIASAAWQSHPHFCHCERSVAISPVQSWPTEKREIASHARNPQRGL